jgi:hypothetical protein
MNISYDYRIELRGAFRIARTEAVFFFEAFLHPNGHLYTCLDDADALYAWVVKQSYSKSVLDGIWRSKYEHVYNLFWYSDTIIKEKVESE